MSVDSNKNNFYESKFVDKIKIKKIYNSICNKNS